MGSAREHSADRAELNLSRAEVHGVVSFYHDFRHEPPGRNIIRSAAPNHARRWARSRSPNIRASASGGLRRTSVDGAFTLEAVYCLGNCACSPAVVINGELLGRMTPERFDGAISNLTADERAIDSRVRAARFQRGLARGGCSGGSDSQREAANGASRSVGSQWLARDVLARADG